jgi:hypothetical protein
MLAPCGCLVSTFGLSGFGRSSPVFWSPVFWFSATCSTMTTWMFASGFRVPLQRWDVCLLWRLCFSTVTSFVLWWMCNDGAWVLQLLHCGSIESFWSNASQVREFPVLRTSRSTKVVVQSSPEDCSSTSKCLPMFAFRLPCQALVCTPSYRVPS